MSDHEDLHISSRTEYDTTLQFYKEFLTLSFNSLTIFSFLSLLPPTPSLPFLLHATAETKVTLVDRRSVPATNERPRANES
jgi:hypothetical protein